MTKRLLSVDEMATFLGVQRDTVYKWIERHGLPARKVGRLWKFRQGEVDQWFNQQPGRGEKAARKTTRAAHAHSWGRGSERRK